MRPSDEKRVDQLRQFVAVTAFENCARGKRALPQPLPKEREILRLQTHLCDWISGIGVEAGRRTGIGNAHLSQLETGTIVRPEPALVWELAVLYDLDFAELLELAGRAGRGDAGGERMTVALRALGEMNAQELSEVLQFMAELKQRRSG